MFPYVIVQRVSNIAMYFLRQVDQVHSYANTNASQRPRAADLIMVIWFLLQKRKGYLPELHHQWLKYGILPKGFLPDT